MYDAITWRNLAHTDYLHTSLHKYYLKRSFVTFKYVASNYIASTFIIDHPNQFVRSRFSVVSTPPRRSVMKFSSNNQLDDAIVAPIRVSRASEYKRCIFRDELKFR